MNNEQNQDQLKEVELADCPICGGQMQLLSMIDEQSTTFGYIVAHLPMSKCSLHYSHIEKDYLVDTWNRTFGNG